MQAGEAGIAEVKFGELAEQRGTSDAVKQYGHHLIEDRTQTNRELMQLATDKGVTPPQDLSDSHKEL